MGSLVKISDVQAGRIGEYLLAVYAMLTSDGALVPFQVDADDDHRDLVVAVKGRSTFASLQAKACFQLGESGFVQSNATYFENTIPRDPSWIYVVVLVLDLAPARLLSAEPAGIVAAAILGKGIHGGKGSGGTGRVRAPAPPESVTTRCPCLPGRS